MTSRAAVRLGIDFGTSSTVAVVAIGDRPPRPLLFDGSPLLPSAVCVDTAGRLLVGREAVQLAAATPDGFEPNPKRCVDDRSVLLAGREFPIEAMFAAVLSRVTDHAARFGGGPLAGVTVTHPAGWGATRRDVLAHAAPAGAQFVAEPVAAAHFFVDVAGHGIPDGATALVYDLGAGTFDASIVRRTGAGFEVVATTGLPDVGGLDIDAAIVARLRSAVGSPQVWTHLLAGADPATRRARQQLWDNVRSAKEVLSRLSTTLVHLPLLDVDVPLGREELDELAGPVIDRTVAATRDLISGAGQPPMAVFLAGGASRMPAVATALHRALGTAPSIVDEPELAVAEGALRVPVPHVTPAKHESLPEPVMSPAAAHAPTGPLAPTAPPPRRRRVVAGAIGAALVLLLTAGTVARFTLDDGVGDGVAARGSGGSGASHSAVPGGSGASHAAGPSRTPEPTVSPSPSHSPGIDPCLLGAWKQQSGQTIGYIDNQPLQYVGARGTVRTFRADGTSLIDYSGSARLHMTHQGSRWEVEHRGTIKARYVADGETVRWSDVRANGTTTLYRNGRVNNRTPLTAREEPDEYTCTTDRLSWASSQNVYSSEWTRVAAL